MDNCKELEKNLSLIPVIPPMRSALVGDRGTMAQTLALESSKLPKGSPFENADFFITSRFGDRVFNHDFQYHRGIDIVPADRNPYERIVATHTGIIEEIGMNPIYGKYVIVNHGNGYKTFYAHLSMIYWQDVAAQKTVGEQVEKGTVLGIIGATGVSTGIHLHYEIRFTAPEGEVVVNPESLLYL